MFKLGIFRFEDYRPEPVGALERLRWSLVRNRISLRLLRTAVPASAAEIAVFEALMQSLRLNSGIYRTTFLNRFVELDRFVNETLAERFAAVAAFDVQDWAASDCLTSSEWAATLLRRFPAARLKATDLTLFLVEVSDGRRTLIQERDGQALQYVTSSFIVNMTRPEQRPQALTSLLMERAKEFMEEVKSRVAIPAEWLDSDSESLAAPHYSVRKLPMVHPAARSFQSSEARFTVSRHSVFDALATEVDVIRSMNIFNLSYFEPAQLAAGARAVWASLKPGGVWIVGRTWRESPPSHNASILEKTESGFRLICRYGDGSEIESIILELRST
jgi:hypothetical protein